MLGYVVQIRKGKWCVIAKEWSTLQRILGLEISLALGSLVLAIRCMLMGSAK